MTFRDVTPADVPALFAVRIATRENAYTREDLRRLEITEESVCAKLRCTHAGWLAEVAGRVVGFAMADRETGELWVIAVLPEFEGRGIGARLMQMAEQWLWDHGCPEAWLTTDVDPALRAYGFYRRCGWEDSGIREGLRHMKKRAPDARATP